MHSKQRLRLNKTFFSRNREREKVFGEIFNKTSSGLSFVVTLGLTFFFTPALVTTSMFSKEIIVMFANCSLSLGYLTNFGYRVYQLEISKSELLVSLSLLAGFIGMAISCLPPLTMVSFISILGLVNRLSLAVNLFFLVKHILVPPLKKCAETVASYLGFDISGRYYSKPQLTLEKDRYVIDQLLIKTYNHDSFSAEFNPTKLERLNKLLSKLSEYIDKYDETFLGYINNKEIISELDTQIMQLTTKGSPHSSYCFIQRKIGYKATKLKLLKEAEQKVCKLINNPKKNVKGVLDFFEESDILDVHKNRKQSLSSGLTQIKREIKRQEVKIDVLLGCLPYTLAEQMKKNMV